MHIVCWARTSAAEAAFLICVLDAALKAPLFHGITPVRAGACRIKLNVKIKIKIKVEGVGQECPTHTGKISVRMPTKVGSTFVGFTSRQEHGKVE